MYLENGHVDIGLEEDVEHQYREELEVLRHVGLGLPALAEQAVDVPKVPGELELADGPAVDAETLAHRDEMGRAVEARAKAMLAEDGLGEGAGRALALRPGHVDYRQAVQLLES